MLQVKIVFKGQFNKTLTSLIYKYLLFSDSTLNTCRRSIKLTPEFNFWSVTYGGKQDKINKNILYLEYSCITYMGKNIQAEGAYSSLAIFCTGYHLF